MTSWMHVHEHALFLEPLRGGNIVRATCRCGTFAGPYRILRETAEQDFAAHVLGVELKAPGAS